MAVLSLDRFLAFRTDLASRAAALSFTSNVSLMVLKFVVGIMTGSVAVLSDAVDSAEDAVASTFAFISIRFAARPADVGHPYGHGKAEGVAAAAQALLITGASGYIVYAATRRLVERDVEIDTGPGLVAMAVTAAVNVGVLLYVRYAARATGSVALKADMRHLTTNVAQAAAVILGLGLVAATDTIIFDPIVALVLAAYLLWTAGGIFAGSLTEIMDVRLPEDEEQLVLRCLSEHDAVRGHHALRTRKAGRQRYVEFHAQIDPSLSVADAHALCDELEASIRDCLPDAVVTIHVEPDQPDAHAEPGGRPMAHPERER